MKKQPQKLDGTPAKKSGRPPKLTPELIAEVAKVVGAGAPMDTAARYCGITRTDFHMWLKKAHELRRAGRRGRQLDFLNALEEAQSRADVSDHASIARAAQKDWKAAANHLRIRNPGRYSEQVNIVVKSQFTAVLDRIEQEFANEPDTLERALAAVAGEDGSRTSVVAPNVSGDGEAEGGGEPDADSLAAVVAAAGVPRPHG